MAEHFLMSRLEEYLGNEVDPWEAGFTLDMVHKTKRRISMQYDPFGPSRPAWWHAARIKFMLEHPDAMARAVIIDCKCAHGRVYATPILLDGWHRYNAHRLLKSETILVDFSGRVDLANYLSGKRKTRPRE